MSFYSPQSQIIIKENYFEKNFADFAGAIFTNHNDGIVFVENNQFCENSVFTQNNILLGSGAVFNMGGTMNTFIESKENIYFMNWAEFKGFFFVFF